MSALKAILQDFIRSRGDRDGVFITPMNHVTIMRNSKGLVPEQTQQMLYTPALCVVVQGAKQINVGAETFEYEEGSALIVSVELPASGRVTRASSEAPYLGMTIEFDIGLMREVMEELETPPIPNADGLSVFVQHLSDPMQDCMLRLARLLSAPEAIAALYPAIMRELYYWLLIGPNGGEICKVVRRDSHTRRIGDAITFLRKNLARPVRVEEMARAARMSPSSFHQHFKTLTALSPVQFQKQLRLLEARKLMVTQAVSVTSAAYQVGYESLSQFSREYARMFGVPPKRDVETLKGHVVPL